jgi:hypothetical protein
MQRTVPNFTELNKLSIFTSWIHKLPLNCLPLLLLCSCRPLNWLLMEERDGYAPSSQHLLRSIGQLAPPLLSGLLEGSWRVVSVVYMLLVVVYLCWIEVYIEINWFDRFWLFQFNWTWCISSLTQSIYLRFMVHWTESLITKATCNYLKAVMLSLYLLICHYSAFTTSQALLASSRLFWASIHSFISSSHPPLAQFCSNW